MNPPRLAIVAAALAVLALVATAWQLDRRGSALPALPPPLAAEQILANIAERHRHIDHLLADARLEVTNHELRRTSRQRGQLAVQRPGKLRWDVYASSSPGTGTTDDDAGPASLERSVICDGAELHSIDFVDSEIIKLRREGHPLILTTALLAAPSWPTAYTAALAPPQPRSADRADDATPAAAYTIVLTPQKPGPRLVVTADAADFHIRQILVDDGYNASRLTLRSLDATAAPDPRRFALDRQSPTLLAFRFVDASI